MSRLMKLICICLVSLVANLPHSLAQDGLSQTHTSYDSMLSFKTPEGWVTVEPVSGGGMIFVGNSDDAFGYAAGEEAITIAIAQPPLFMLMLRAQPKYEADAPEKAIEAFIDGEMGGNAPAVIKLTKIKVGPRPAWQLSGSTEYDDYMWLFIQFPDENLLALQAETGVGKMAAAKTTVLAIAETMTFSPSDITSSDDAPVIGLWGASIGQSETFKVMLVKVMGDKLDMIGIVCAPNGRPLGNGIFFLSGDIPISSEGKFVFESSQMVIEGRFTSSTEATGTLESREDLSECGIPKKTKWHSTCDLNVTGFGELGMSSNAISREGRLVTIEQYGYEFDETETGSCEAVK